MLLIVQLFYIIPYIRNREIAATKLDQLEIANNIALELDIGLRRIEDRLLRMANFPEFRNINNAFAKMLDHNKEGLISENYKDIYTKNSVDKLKEFETRPNNKQVLTLFTTLFPQRDPVWDSVLY